MSFLPRHLVATLLVLLAGCAAQHRHGQAEPMPHHFDDPQKWARSWDDPEREQWQRPAEVLAALSLPSTASVADLGAGTGFFATRLAKTLPAGKVYAVDVEPSMVRYLEERAHNEKLPNLVAVLASPEDARLPAAVDLVLVVNTYHHVSERPAYFRKLSQRLTPGGRVAIIDYKKGVPHGPPDEHKLLPEQVVAEMTAAGLRLVGEHDFLPRQYFLLFERP